MTNRRSFSKKLLLASGSVLTAPAWANIHISKRKTIGVALVGLGYYSRDLLAPALQLTRHAELRGIVTGSPEKIPVWQSTYNIPDRNVYDYNSMHQAANNDDIDVFYIVLPPSMHKDYTLVSANAGKHTWCEKPMAVTEKECQAMIDGCKKNKVKLAIGYRMHHEPNTGTVMEWAKSKPYGPISEIKAEAGYREGRTNHWKQQKAMGGGAMFDMGVYTLNAARYSSGEEPVAVTASHSTTRPDVYKEVDETTKFTLEFPSGATAQCLTSFGMGLNELRVEAEKGWYQLKPFQAYNGVSGRTSDGKLLNKPISNQQAQQMDNDARSIMENTSMRVPGEEGLKDIRVVEAIFKSAAQGKRVVI